MKLLIISHGWIGDNILASSLAENCFNNGFEHVDILIGFPHTYDLLKLLPFINNVFVSGIPGSYPTALGVDLTIYDRIYSTPHLVFNEKPLDTFNKSFGFRKIKYDFQLNSLNDVRLSGDKPKIAFQTDWYERTLNRKLSNQNYIINSLLDTFNVLMVGKTSVNGVTSQFSIDENTSHDFLIQASAMKNCDYFFGYPGGLHWVASGLGVKTITTSDSVINSYTKNGSFSGLSFDVFKTQWMVHANKQFNNEHILLEPLISDDEIIKFIKNLV